MKRSEWEKVAAAAKLLQLEETATLKQIKSAFRRMCKKHHPDLAAHQDEVESMAVQEIHEAYEVLLQYCKDFRFPLKPQDSDQSMEAEDWWMDRFGQDPLWGKN